VFNRHCFGSFLVVAALAVLPTASIHSAAPVQDDPAAVAHVLNRLSFGPRAGDVDRAREMGLQAWVDRQLHPERIDDGAVETRLLPLSSPPDSADPKELRRFARRQVVTLGANKIVREVYSERQLQEVLVNFWFNHFNVYAGKGRTAQFLPEYESDVIRPHVLGRFRDLLEATAKSPAMLMYLDNWRSTAPDATRGARLGVRAQDAKRPRGLNENYGRELLELHTLGVNGGYTQEDVIEVARAFTGWTIDRAGQFRFARAAHDRGDVVVLGHRIAAGGIEQGERVLDILASHPSTAHHIAFALAQQLVSDDPSPALVDRAAARFTATSGDLREVVRTIVTSPEFLAPATRGAKFKTPLEFVVSALRATGAEVRDGRPFVQALQELGEPLFMCQPPTGYRNTAETWVSAGGLVNRMNLATRLTSGGMRVVALPDGTGDPEALALHLGSPEFQRR
jgi:uncharacterized protein (DUF1800 family)